MAASPISIRFDLSPALARLTRQPAALVRRGGTLAAKRAAEAYLEEMQDWVAAGHAYQDRSGHLSQSLGWRADGEGAIVYAQAPHAPHIEFGTRAHLIRPREGRRALRWYPAGGGVRFARQVRHPGTQPSPFFFADADRRQGVMLAAGREAIAEVLLA